MDGDLRWAPTGDRVAIEGHLGALILLDDRLPREDCSAAFRGCLAGADTHWCAFEDWSPDGKRALLTRYPCKNPAERQSRGDLHVLDAAAKRTERLLPGATLGSWSPDGSQIAFVRFASRSYEVGILDLATKKAQQIARFSTAAPAAMEASWFRPLWSPDGRRLVQRDEKGDLWAVRPDGSDRRPITRGRRAQPSWSPDGKRLALTVGYENPDPMPLAIVELP